MAILGIVNKQPREVIDFDISYADALAGRTSTLATAISEVSPTGLTLVDTIIVSATKKTKVIISGGTTGTTYKVTVLTSTDDGLTLEDEVTVIVEEV